MTCRLVSRLALLCTVAVLCSASTSSSGSSSSSSSSLSGSILEYSFAAYNNLLDYRIARTYAFDNEAIASLGEIFMSYNVNDTFGLCLLHNHFHVHEGELMVEVVSNDTSNTFPQSLSWKFQPGMSKNDVQPSMMGLTEDGDLRPFEFLDVRHSNFTSYTDVILPGLQRFYSNPQTYSAFFKALAAKLTDMKLRDIFGVCVRHRDSIVNTDPNFSSLEVCKCVSCVCVVFWLVGWLFDCLFCLFFLLLLLLLLLL